jgi:hypothetical protein
MSAFDNPRAETGLDPEERHTVNMYHVAEKKWLLSLCPLLTPPPTYEPTAFLQVVCYKMFVIISAPPRLVSSWILAIIFSLVTFHIWHLELPSLIGVTLVGNRIDAITGFLFPWSHFTFGILNYHLLLA